jgi:hypothetical protein
MQEEAIEYSGDPNDRHTLLYEGFKTLVICFDPRPSRFRTHSPFSILAG